MEQNEQTSLLGKCLTTYIRQLDQHNNIKSNIVYVTTRPYKSRKLVVKSNQLKLFLALTRLLICSRSLVIAVTWFLE